MATITVSLASHPHENRTLMCWYEMKIGRKTVQFRSDAFVSKEDEKKLHQFHCTCTNIKQLTNKCFDLLDNHLDKIQKEVEDFLKLSFEDQKEFSHKLVMKSPF